MVDRKRISIVNNLIATTIDGADGYREAAKDVEHSGFRSMFVDGPRERDEDVAMLQPSVSWHAIDL